MFDSPFDARLRITEHRAAGRPGRERWTREAPRDVGARRRREPHHRSEGPRDERRHTRTHCECGDPPPLQDILGAITYTICVELSGGYTSCSVTTDTFLALQDPPYCSDVAKILAAFPKFTEEDMPFCLQPSHHKRKRVEPPPAAPDAEDDEEDEEDVEADASSDEDVADASEEEEVVEESEEDEEEEEYDEDDDGVDSDE